MTQTNVLIAEDHAVVRASLCSLLNAEPDLRVVGEAADGLEALNLAQRHNPDVVVTDLQMPGADGMQVAEDIREQLPATRVLILTVYDDPGLQEEALRVGAAGYVSKRSVLTDLVAAIRAVARGEIYARCERLRTTLRDRRQAAPEQDLVLRLEAGERQVLALMAQGYTLGKIAAEMNLALGDVNELRAHVSDKLGVRSRIEMIEYARKHGLAETA